MPAVASGTLCTMKKPTRINHPPSVGLPPGNRPLVDPIYQSVKFEFDEIETTLKSIRGEAPGFFYTRVSNPTLRQLELLLAEMQGRDDAIVLGSGVAATSAVFLSLLRQGDHVLGFVETYAPTRRALQRILGRFGVSLSLISIDDLEGAERILAEKLTRLVVFESPTNPVTKIADIERITAIAHKHGALVVLDNTFAGLHNHGQYDIDLFTHSLTKFASGHSDVMGGAIIGSADLIRSIRSDHILLGALLDPHAAFLVLRGLKTYFLRYRAICTTAQKVAEFLTARGEVECVHYPGLAFHPQHARARAQMQDFGGVVTFDLKGGEKAATVFCEALELFGLTASVGSTESLVMAPQMLKSHDLTAEQRRISGVREGTVRLSIGIEDPDDLLADLSQALDRASRST
jgi:cystathionine beta-lyase/cystathionine gamma-synthase